jgi:hypothetical protein
LTGSAEQVAEDRPVSEREQAHPAIRRLVHVTAGTQFPFDPLDKYIRMVGL